MNKQQRQAKLQQIRESSLCGRILELIDGESWQVQLAGLAGAQMQVLVDTTARPEQRAHIVRRIAESMITEMNASQGLTDQELEDRLFMVTEPRDQMGRG